MSLKEDILKQLKNSPTYVSGQQLSEDLNVSRTAVWKAIGRLKEEGYPIIAVQNRGYRLDDKAVQDSDVLNEAELRERLDACTKWAGHPVIYCEETGSTNDDIMELADKGAPEGTLAVASRQTKGKGRRGRVWESPNEGNIYMSFLVRPKMSTDIVPMITIVMALAMCQACNEICGGVSRDGSLTHFAPPSVSENRPLTRPASPSSAAQIQFGIKWPNDVVGRSKSDPAWKKMVGILTELRLEEREIKDATIGTGVNVNMTEFPEELKNKATSMKILTGHTVNRADVIAVTWKYFEEDYEQFVSARSLAPLREKYEELLVNKGRAVRVLDPQVPYTGTAIGINDGGELLVRPDAGEFPDIVAADGTVKPDTELRAVYAGEVSVRGVEGYV